MNWLVRISNTHRELSIKEIENLLGDYDLNWKNELLFTIECSQLVIDELCARSASIKWVMKNPTILEINDEIYTSFNSINYSKQTPETDTKSFAVRFIQILDRDKTIRKSKIERSVGGKILEHYDHLSVNLEEPDQEYRVLRSGNFLYTGWIYKFIDFDKISSMSPKESPFFGGGAMKPMMAQLMVNLISKNCSVVLDPFCGHGGFLREISAKNWYAIGIEITWKIIRENRINNDYHNTGNIAIMAGDALRPPLRNNAIDAIVCDPPYAKQSTTIGRDREKLVDNWLENQNEKTIILSLPVDMKIKIPDKYMLEFSVKDYVHRSLTRVVRKLRLKE